jgi:hypothetical protein
MDALEKAPPVEVLFASANWAASSSIDRIGKTHCAWGPMLT